MASDAAEGLRKALKAGPGWGEMPWEAERADHEKVMASFTPRADTTGIERDRALAGEVPVEWMAAAEARSERVVLFFHGGGFTLGSAESHLDLEARLARALEARVLAVDYRLAPEHPYPAAIVDCVYAYRWLLDQGTPPGGVVLTGLSSGGGLVLSTMLVLRDEGLPLPAAGVCLCPLLDMTLGAPSIERNAGKDWLSGESLGMIVETYLAGADAAQPLASPVFADLAGLPPLFLQCGGDELLMDDSVLMADQAAEYDVRSELDVWPEMYHAWQLFAARVPEGGAAIERAADFLLSTVEVWRLGA